MYITEKVCIWVRYEYYRGYLLDCTEFVYGSILGPGARRLPRERVNRFNPRTFWTPVGRGSVVNGPPNLTYENSIKE